MIINTVSATPQATIVTVTPDVAKALLELNTHNRNVFASRVREYAGKMASQRWLFNGDPIRFDKAGNLIDGQHRLNAIIECNHTLENVVLVTGIEKEAQSTMDQGLKRDAAQQLKLEFPWAVDQNVLAAAIKRLIQWYDGEKTFTQGKNITHAEVLAYFEDHQELNRECREVSKLSYVPKTGLTKANILVAYHLIGRESTELGEKTLAEVRQSFFGFKGLQELGYENHPALQLVRMAKYKWPHGSGVNHVIPVNTTLKAWNLYLTESPDLLVPWKPWEGQPKIV